MICLGLVNSRGFRQMKDSRLLLEKPAWTSTETQHMLVLVAPGPVLKSSTRVTCTSPPVNCISEATVALFTPLRLFDSLSDELLCRLKAANK